MYHQLQVLRFFIFMKSEIRSSHHYHHYFRLFFPLKQKSRHKNTSHPTQIYKRYISLYITNSINFADTSRRYYLSLSYHHHHHTTKFNSTRHHLAAEKKQEKQIYQCLIPNE